MVVAGFAMYNCCDDYSCCYSLIVSRFHYNYAPVVPITIYIIFLEEKPELMVYNSATQSFLPVIVKVPEEAIDLTGSAM